MAPFCLVIMLLGGAVYVSQRGLQRRGRISKGQEVANGVLGAFLVFAGFAGFVFSFVLSLS